MVNMAGDDGDLPPDVTTSKRPLWMPPEKSAEEKERDDAMMRPDFEFDATTVTALLGAAIAFQFFVLANL